MHKIENIDFVGLRFVLSNFDSSLNNLYANHSLGMADTTSTDKIEWRVVPGYPNYSVSNVRSVKHNVMNRRLQGIKCEGLRFPLTLTKQEEGKIVRRSRTFHVQKLMELTFPELCDVVSAEWRKIPGFQTYSISKSRQVRNDVSGKLLYGNAGTVRFHTRPEVQVLSTLNLFDPIQHFNVVECIMQYTGTCVLLEKRGDFSISITRLMVLIYPEAYEEKGVTWRALSDHRLHNYEVSSQGVLRNKSTKRTVGSKNKDGYVEFKLRQGTHFFVHNLVADAFLPPRPSPQHTLNHGNLLRWDNRVVNLNWATGSEQVKHSFQGQLRKQPINQRRVEQQDLDGNNFAVHRNLAAAARTLNGNAHQDALRIRQACLGESGVYKNFIWSYKDELISAPTDLPDEIWKPCKTIQIYLVSNKGRVKNAETSRIIAPCLRRGYPAVGLMTGKHQRKWFPVNVLVAEVFVANDNPSKKNEVHHRDEDPTNNCAENLEWVTHMENVTKTCGIIVTKIDPQTDLPVATFASMAAADRSENFPEGAVGVAFRAGREYRGFLWRAYEENDDALIEFSNNDDELNNSNLAHTEDKTRSSPDNDDTHSTQIEKKTGTSSNDDGSEIKSTSISQAGESGNGHPDNAQFADGKSSGCGAVPINAQFDDGKSDGRRESLTSEAEKIIIPAPSANAISKGANKRKRVEARGKPSEAKHKHRR